MLRGELPLDDISDLHLKIISASASVCCFSLWSFRGRARKESQWGGGRSWTLGQSQRTPAEPLGMGMALQGCPGSGPRGGQTLISLAGPRAPLRAACTCAFISQPQGTTSHRDTSALMLVMRNCRCRTVKMEKMVGADTEPGKRHLGVGTPPGGSRSLSRLPRPQRSCWPRRVCATLGWNATTSEKVLSCWPAEVNVCVCPHPLGHPPLRLARGFCASIPESVEGLRGPLGFRWGRGLGSPSSSLGEVGSGFCGHGLGCRGPLSGEACLCF